MEKMNQEKNEERWANLTEKSAHEEKWKKDEPTEQKKSKDGIEAEKKKTKRIKEFFVNCISRHCKIDLWSILDRLVADPSPTR